MTEGPYRSNPKPPEKDGEGSMPLMPEKPVADSEPPSEFFDAMSKEERNFWKDVYLRTFNDGHGWDGVKRAEAADRAVVRFRRRVNMGKPRT